MKDVLSILEREENYFKFCGDCYKSLTQPKEEFVLDVWKHCIYAEYSELATLFREMIIEGLPATEEDYTREYLKIAMMWYRHKNNLRKSFMTDNAITTAEITFKRRASSAWMSNIVELSLKDKLKRMYPNFRFIDDYHGFFDLKLGVDIICKDVDKGTIHYIHVTKNSNKERQITNDKEKNRTRGRDFSKHIFFKYEHGEGTENNDTNYFLDGIPIFKETYIKSKIQESEELCADLKEVESLLSQYNSFVKNKTKFIRHDEMKAKIIS